MWYLQFHDVCAIMLLSMGSFFIDKSSNVFLVRLAGQLIITHWRIFSHRLTSFEPRDYRVVFVLQKEETGNPLPHLFC